MLHFYYMLNRKPPAIHFFEDESLSKSPFLSSRLTKFVSFCTFGLIKEEAHASIIMLFAVIVCMLITIWYVNTNLGVVPTTTFELLPQETVGSGQGKPPVVPRI